MIFGIILFLICVYVIYSFDKSEKEKEKEINKVFDKMVRKYKPLEKSRVIKELFIDCTNYCGKNLSDADNELRYCVYTGELALHIFCAWIVGIIGDLDNKKAIIKIIEGSDFAAFIFAIKHYINKIIKTLGKKELDTDTVFIMLYQRITQILKTEDFQILNFDFLNICNFAIKSKEDTVFLCENLDNFQIVPPSNPLDLMFLPLAYKSGLVRKYFEKFNMVFKISEGDYEKI